MQIDETQLNEAIIFTTFSAHVQLDRTCWEYRQRPNKEAGALHQSAFSAFAAHLLPDLSMTAIFPFLVLSKCCKRIAELVETFSLFACVLSNFTRSNAFYWDMTHRAFITERGGELHNVPKKLSCFPLGLQLFSHSSFVNWCNFPQNPEELRFSVWHFGIW